MVRGDWSLSESSLIRVAAHGEPEYSTGRMLLVCCICSQHCHFRHMGGGVQVRRGGEGPRNRKGTEGGSLRGGGASRALKGRDSRVAVREAGTLASVPAPRPA